MSKQRLLSKRNLATLLPLFLILSIDGMSYGVIIPMLNPLFMNPQTSILPAASSETLRHLYFGITMAVFPIAVIIGTPLLGMLSDRIGRKKTLMISLLGAALGMFIACLSIDINSVALLLCSRIIIGLTSAGQPIAQASIADISDQKVKANNLSMIALAMTIGMVAGPLAGGYLSDSSLVSWFSVATPFWFGGILALANALLLVFTYRETADNQLTQSWSIGDSIKYSLLVFKNKNLLHIAGLFLLLELAWSLYFLSAPLILAKQHGFSSEQIGLFISFLGFCMGIGLAFIFGLFNRLMSLEKIARYSFIISALGLFGAMTVQQKLAQWLFSIPLTICVGIGYTALLTLISNYAPKQIQGWVMGFASSLLALAWALTGIFSGLLTQYLITLPTSIALLFMFIGFIGTLKVRASPACYHSSGIST